MTAATEAAERSAVDTANEHGVEAAAEMPAQPERPGEKAAKQSSKQKKHAASKAVVAERKAAAAARRVPPIPPVAANLLPDEVVHARRTRAVRRAVIFAMVPVLAVLAGAYGLATVRISLAERDLARAEKDTTFLQGQEQSYSEVTRTRAKSAQIVRQLHTLFADDIAFAKLFRPLQDVAPDGIKLTDLSASKTTGKGGTYQLPGAPGVQVVGRLTVAGSAPSKAVVASYVDALLKVHGVANPLLTNIATTDNGVQFSVQADITAAAVGGRYTVESGK
jgi:hypothetical protein